LPGQPGKNGRRPDIELIGLNFIHFYGGFELTDVSARRLREPAVMGAHEVSDPSPAVYISEFNLSSLPVSTGTG
jgi:hypothetical protein